MSRREEMNTNEINALLGRGSSFEGKLSFEGTVRIEGAFSGEIHTNDTLVIGQGADVKAQIFAGNVIVSGGTVTGNIHAKHMIELEKEATVRGDLETPALRIEKGVIFQGSCRMENLGQPRPAEVAAPPSAASTDRPARR
ncbi:MAG: polymer-forming cytoskeletal protein [Pseudomonadota bacterium]|nr:MAG: polymer-forming cytoskeletal protein [Pseudomonadota bacterium]